MTQIVFGFEDVTFLDSNLVDIPCDNSNGIMKCFMISQRV